MSYKIVRRWFNGGKRVMAKGLSLETAQAWCRDPQTSSTTCTLPRLVRMTKARGPWFDGYEEER